MPQTVKIVVACDCDPDRPVFGGSRLDSKNTRLAWRGVTEGIPLLTSRLERLPFPVPILWAVRCDEQVALCHGAASWSLTEHGLLWERLEARGDEIAWHKHTWRWSADQGRYFQEIHDDTWIAEHFEKWAMAFRGQRGRLPLTSHGGWFFQNNATLAALARAGIKLDYSALPGRSQTGFAGRDGAGFSNQYDWSISPRHPYSPSVHDYRRPAQAGEESLPLTVAPTYTFQSLAASAFQAASYAVRRNKGGERTHKAQNKLSVITVTNHPTIFKGLIDYAVAERPELLIVYFHPDELLADHHSWKTHLFSAKNVVANLRNLVRRFQKQGLTPVFGTGAGLVIPDTTNSQ